MILKLSFSIFKVILLLSIDQSPPPGQEGGTLLAPQPAGGGEQAGVTAGADNPGRLAGKEDRADKAPPFWPGLGRARRPGTGRA